MKPFDVLIVRALIHIQSVRWSLEKGIGYVRISSFTEKATREFVDAVVTMRSQSGDALQGIVLDLRNNPGGLLEQSVRISDELLERGNIVSTQSRVDRNNFEAQSGDIAAGLPIVVLVLLRKGSRLGFTHQRVLGTIPHPFFTPGDGPLPRQPVRHDSTSLFSKGVLA